MVMTWSIYAWIQQIYSFSSKIIFFPSGNFLLFSWANFCVFRPAKQYFWRSRSNQNTFHKIILKNKFGANKNLLPKTKNFADRNIKFAHEKKLRRFYFRKDIKLKIVQKTKGMEPIKVYLCKNSKLRPKE